MQFQTNPAQNKRLKKLRVSVCDTHMPNIFFLRPLWTQGSKLVVVRWPEATKFSAGPPEHWVAVVRQATKIFQHKIV